MNIRSVDKTTCARCADIIHKLALVAMAALLPLSAFAGPNYGPWSANVNITDITPAVAGGCPIESRDGLTLYTARPSPTEPDDDVGDLNIWVNSRADADSPFGDAMVLPPPVNEPDSDEFCPTPIGGNYLLFVSTRAGGCGASGGDIYIARLNPATGWDAPVNLGCADLGEGPNTSGGEFSPGIIETDQGTYLYYSSDGSGNHDLYVSEMQADGRFAAGTPIAELNTDADDRMPTLTKDGLEIVFSSSRENWFGGSAGNPGQDVYYSSRESLSDPWSSPVNLSVTVPLTTEADGETRASFSWDRTHVYYGSGGSVYVIEREKLTGRP